MVASSVTGVGLGDSNGKQKPQNHSSCGCYPTSVVDTKVKKNKCNFIKYNYCSKVIKYSACKK